MALGQRRMVYTNLWQNPQFALLPDKAKILYIATITLADDDGRLRANSLLLRSQVFPLEEKITQIEVRKWLNLIVKSKLLDFYSEKDEYFIQHPNWEKYQSIRKDLYKPSKLPKNPLRKRNVAVQKSHPNLIQSNISKDKISSVAYLEKIPEEDIKYFTERFDMTKKQLESKAESLVAYCEMHGKTYRNYRSFLLNSIKNDFPERKTPQKVQSMHPAQELRAELTLEAKETMKKIREDIKGISIDKSVK